MGDFNNHIEWKHKYHHRFIYLVCAAYCFILYSCSTLYKVKLDISKTGGFHSSIVRNQD